MRAGQPLTKKCVWEQPFLDALRQTGTVLVACRRANISRPTAYRRKKTNKKFRKAWEVAVEDSLDIHEYQVHKASIDGDAATSRWILARRRPEKWGDVKIGIQHSGKISTDTQRVEILLVGDDSEVDISMPGDE